MAVESSDRERRPRPWLRTVMTRLAGPSLLFLSVAAVELVAIRLLASWLGFGPIDDAYISLRYARNWAEGAGLVYNPGEIVEGYTSFLVVALETLLIRSGIDPVLAMQCISNAAAAGVAGLAALFIRRHIFPGRDLLAVTAGALIGLNPILLAWGASGMESCLFALFVLAALMAALSSRPATRLFGPAFLVTLAALARPEGMILLPVFPILIFVRERSANRALLQAAWMWIPFGVYFLLRAIHFGAPFPNTFYAKLDYGGARLAWRGLVYVADFVRASALVVAACGVALMLIRKAPAWPRALLAVAVLLVLATVYEGGDHFALFRFLVPVVPLLGLVALFPAARLATRTGAHRFVGRLGIGATLLILGLTDATLGRAMTRLDLAPQTHVARFAIESETARSWLEVGRWLGEVSPPDGTVATVAIGAIGYESRLRMLDPVGLIDVTIAHRRVELGGGYSGHEKTDVERILAQNPTYVLVIHILTPFPLQREELASYAWGDFNRLVLEHPRLASEYTYRVTPISGGYLNYFVRSDSIPRERGRAS